MASSTPKLWATASKEWVIQPKPKPGRKPKKDSEAVDKLGEDEENTKGRRVQNRAAQRAFRERKQSQLAELQARLQSYEQGEIERSVVLQNIAKRLKEENDKLRQENQTLQAKVARLEENEQQNTQPETLTQEPEKKRWREESSQSLVQLSPPTKRSRLESENNAFLPSSFSLGVSHLPSPVSIVSTPDSGGQDDSNFPSTSFDTHTRQTNSSLHQLGDISSDSRQANHSLDSFTPFGCGFCTDGTICMCREMMVQQVTDQVLHSLPTTQPQTHSQDALLAVVLPLSILDNLPAYQPPVPLKRRTGGAPITPIFRIDIPSQSSSSIPTCSGDPSNCLACADDTFGQAFCASIGTSSRVCNSCDDCPGKFNCEMGDKCCQATGHTTPLNEEPSRVSTPDNEEVIPTNDAWQKIKQHPNVEFSDLALLAEVVASRTKCTGPRYVFAAEREPSMPPNQSNVSTIPEPSFDGPRHTNRQGRSPPPMLVPHDILVECGRRNLRHVHVDGVRDALRLLDAKFAQ